MAYDKREQKHKRKLERRPKIMQFKYIPASREQHKKRVAAYCRVSTLLTEQEESIEFQKSYYRTFIENHPDWEFAGIFSDEKSGLSVANRAGFQEMIDVG